MLLLSKPKLFIAFFATLLDLGMSVAPAGGLPDAEIRDLAIAPSTPTTLRAASSDAATFTVTNTADSGPGSLREAILNSNASAGVLDTIAFNVGGPGCSGSPAICTIVPATALPAISDPVILDATTQPGYSGSPLIQISTGSLSDGLLVTAGGTTIRGLSIVGFNYGIRLTTNGGNTIQASWLGLRPDGSQGGNSEGIHIASSGNQIGGTSAVNRNIVATNLSGIVLEAGTSNNSIQGNFVGTDPTGTSARPNGLGISLNGTGNVIGGTSAGSGNLISGNAEGIAVFSVCSNQVSLDGVGGARHAQSRSRAR